MQLEGTNYAENSRLKSFYLLLTLCPFSGGFSYARCFSEPI